MEKLHIADNANDKAIAAEIAATVFHGDQWLYQVHTSLGDLIVTEPNRGHEPRKRGDRVTITWTPNAIRVLPRAAGHG